MAGAKTRNQNAGMKGGQRSRFLKGTDEQVIRIMIGGGKRRFVWGVKENDGDYRHVSVADTELR
jgi:hypothetical protein